MKIKIYEKYLNQYNMPPSTSNGTDLRTQEWHKALFLLYIKIPQTSLPTAMNVETSFQYPSSYIVKRSASSRLSITSSMIGLDTWPARFSPSCICATSPSYTQVFLCRRARNSRPDYWEAIIHQPSGARRSIKGTS